MDQNGLKGIQYGLWAIAVAIIVLALCQSLTEKLRYLPIGSSGVLDTYTGQRFIIQNKNSLLKEPSLRLDPFTKKITD